MSSLVAKGMKKHTILPKMERKGVSREMRGQGRVGGEGKMGFQGAGSSHREKSEILKSLSFFSGLS